MGIEKDKQKENIQWIQFSLILLQRASKLIEEFEDQLIEEFEDQMLQL